MIVKIPRHFINLLWDTCFEMTTRLEIQTLKQKIETPQLKREQMSLQ